MMPVSIKTKEQISLKHDTYQLASLKQRKGFLYGLDFVL
jgi:hypothetical protein